LAEANLEETLWDVVIGVTTIGAAVIDILALLQPEFEPALVSGETGLIGQENEEIAELDAEDAAVVASLSPNAKARSATCGARRRRSRGVKRSSVPRSS
jgi:hypothetical protein